MAEPMRQHEPMISQEILQRYHDLEAAAAEFAELKTEIGKALKDGAMPEPGPRTVKVTTYDQVFVPWKAKFLAHCGEALAKRIAAATKPTTCVKFEVR